MSDATIGHLEYLAMLVQIDSLFEDNDSNKHRIDRLAPLIEQYESTSSYFTEFNQSVAGLSSSQSLLQILMDQHGIAPDPISDILGDPKVLAAVLDGQQALTSQQLMELSKWFGILPGLAF